MISKMRGLAGWTTVGLALTLVACADGDQDASMQAGDPALGQYRVALARLAHRRQLITDANDIKRLQRAYGYYVDQARWDDIVDLFADDGTIEIGLDGVYEGKARIRAYLYALGGGRSGLAEGQINEHMQLMPVVTVAPDGQSARGRWRALIMAGTLGENAIWGEGPYENEYVKVDGVWKLKSVHWYQSVVVPYEGGWQVNPDINGGKWVSAELPPDRPPTVEYETWPGTYLPPFHFPNPVAGVTPADWGAAADTSRFADVAPDALAAAAGALAQEVALLEDENAIEQLQRIYGFYIDKGFWSEAADLFADDATIEVAGSGVFVGKARVLEYLRSRGAEFPQEGRLFDRMQLQPIVHVAPDGQSARARWRLFAQEARHGEFARWGVGVYENTYVKDRGQWKIQSLHAQHRMYTPYEDGWGKTALPNDGPSASLPPDRPPTGDYAAYPSTEVLAFHYQNPVTGAPTFAQTPTQFAAPVAYEALGSTLDSLAQRIGRLEDTDQLERLNAIYGYYLARNQWDDFTGLFARNGTIEIAMRGVYAGQASVRRNLNLYGEAGVQHGLLHNHMQYQPVIDIAEDGLSAKMRSRAFSIMGEYETYSMWMGGVYENDYVKEDGVWKLLHDQQFNTYFAPYAVGWKDLAPRPPPGISESNPPDAPPTHPFEMYPRAFLPPFHYANPVTGRAVVWEPQ
jgi:hypothetical protein